MLSLCAPAPVVSTDKARPRLNMLPNLQDAVASFTSVVERSGAASVRLQCAVPTSMDACLDLHDLHELRARVLVFIHDLTSSLRANGISASYSLLPSHSSFCLVTASAAGSRGRPIDIDSLQASLNGSLKREQVVLLDGPCLVIT